MIRIISGWSALGGSTTSFINLTNAFNNVGIDCIFYGPHEFHLNKCRSALISSDNKFIIDKSDNLIIHFRTPAIRPACKKVILSCHEQNVFEISKINLNVFDAVHFVSVNQIKYHNISYPNFVIPNILDNLKANPKTSEKVVGIIGSVDYNKQTHISIQRAIGDGFDDIRLFGAITDLPYWESSVKPLVDNVRVKYIGVELDKQKMYDQITDVYFSSIRECRPMIIGECIKTNTKLHTIEGKEYLNQNFIYTNEEIINHWKEKLEV